MSRDARLLQPTDGTTIGRFGLREWAMLASTSLLWGSSYLWIAIGLEEFPPAVLAWMRLALGAAILAVLARPYRRIERSDWLGIAIVGVAGNAAPALLFALAEQRVESAVVGMLTGATPLATLVLAVAVGTRSLRRVHMVGLALGFAGVVIMSIPNLTGDGASPLGIGFVLLAVAGYAVTSIVIGPLQARYGGMTVVLHAQLVAVALMTPYGLAEVGSSGFSVRSFLAIVILGIFGTGVARAVHANLIGRTGPARAGIVGYLVPVTAVVLGIVVLSESVSLVEWAGLGIVLVGAFLTSSRIAPQPERSPISTA